MKNSIETRHPFLDFNVIKFAMNMNIHDRAGIIGKNSLRKISKKFNIKNWNIPKKHGFGGSLEFNYMSKDFKEFLIDNRDTWKDYFDDEKFKKVFEKNIYDSSNWRAFSIMMWLIWLNELKKNFYEINK